MRRLRSPSILVGIAFIIIGAGNWYTGVDKGAEYDRLLAAGNRPPSVDYEDFHHLTARTAASLLAPLQRGSDEYTLANAKLDFYKVVQSGGRMLMLFGLFCSAAGVIRSWRHRHGTEGNELPAQQ